MNKLPESIEQLSEPSEYLQEVLATPPRWIIRWGEVLVLLLVITLLILGYLIRYPDRIAAEVVITTPHPPVEIVARADGQLTNLFVADHDSVKQGALLAIVQNAAHYPDIVTLQHQLDSLAVSSAALDADSMFNQAYQLGTLQQPYASAQQAWKEYSLYLQLTPAYQQQQAVDRQLRRFEALLTQKQQQQQLLERKIQLAQKDYNRNEQLHASQTIADKALEESERALLEVKEAYEALLSELAQIRVQVAGLQREWQQLNTQHTQEGEQLRATLSTALKNLQSQITLWEERYLLKASQAGIVSFFDFWSEQQYVQTGQVVMRIVPTQNQQAVGRLRVPVQNFGKVAIGQEVQVYLDNYPYQEYGTLQGMVQNLSDLPQEGYYSVAITFPKGLITQYGKTILFQQQLSGQAEIITEDLRLLERFFYRLRTALDTNS